MNFFTKMWWKYIGVVLLLVVICCGLFIPLDPGITESSPDTVSIGQVNEIEISTYNTDLKWGMSGLSMFLKHNNQIIKADSVYASGPQRIKALVQIPYELDGQSTANTSYDIIVMIPEIGTLTQRNGVQVQNTNIEALDMKPASSALMSNIIPTKTFGFPNREIIQESIRNLFFHVPMWFGMVFLLLFSFVSSIRYLNNNDEKIDIYASTAAEIGLLFGILGIFTGMLWANYTWGAPWPNDPKLNGAAIAMLIYIAYAILRSSITDPIRKAKVSAVYNVFAFIIYLSFVFIYPRLTDSLHPGNGGNPAFSNADLDNKLRMFFYPAVAGWTILGFWLASLKIRYKFALRFVHNEAIK